MTINKLLIAYFSLGINLWLAFTIINASRLNYKWSDIVQTLKDSWLRNMLFIFGWVIILPPLLLNKNK